MAYQVGGLEGINKAIECKNIATCEYSSGLQVSGVFTEVDVPARVHESPRALDLSAHTGPTALAFQNKELAGHGRDHHAEGFGSPIGRWRKVHAAPENLSDDQLHRSACRRQESDDRIRKRRHGVRARSKRFCGRMASCS